MIPWEFRVMLPKGVNVDDYVKVIPAWKHNLKPFGIHTGSENYNKLWREFFRNANDLTPTRVLNKMYELNRSFGLNRYDWVRP